MVATCKNNKLPTANFNTSSVWDEFAAYNKLTPKLLEQFKLFAQELVEWNTRHNITTITDQAAIVQDHFQDSLMLAHACDLSKAKGIIDVGSGGGFPGIPLALLTPNVPVTLIEVSQKKLAFLELLIEKLELTNVTLFEQDWRRFLRSTNKPASYICARASISVDELTRMFKPSSAYKEETLVYWASCYWQARKMHNATITCETAYTLSDKNRRLVFMGQSIA
jgi:16S rRNA (guanine(527)-N(7))-methyltransferase RsmG